MSVKRRHAKTSRELGALFIVALIATVGLLVAATPESGSARLVSVEQLPEEMSQTCAWNEPVPASFDGGPTQVASLQTENLFAAMRQEGAHAPLMASLMPLQQRGQAMPAPINATKQATEIRKRISRNSGLLRTLIRPTHLLP